MTISRWPAQGSSSGSLSWGDAVPSFVNLPAGSSPGEIRLVIDTATLYIWNGSSWVLYLDAFAVAQLPIDLTADVTGVLPIANGGTGSATGFTDQQNDIANLQAQKLDLAGGTMTGPLILVGAPTGALEAAPKAYVDQVAQGLDTKASAAAATTANILLSGLLTIDGVALIAGDRVVVKDQTTPSENGIWIVAAGGWSRAVDFDTWSEVPGAFVFVKPGQLTALQAGYV